LSAIEDDSDSNKGQMRRIWEKLLRQMLMWCLLWNSWLAPNKKIEGAPPFGVCSLKGRLDQSACGADC